MQKCETYVWVEKKLNRLARWLALRAAILKTEEALGRMEHVVMADVAMLG